MTGQCFPIDHLWNENHDDTDDDHDHLQIMMPDELYLFTQAFPVGHCP